MRQQTSRAPKRIQALRQQPIKIKYSYANRKQNCVLIFSFYTMHPIDSNCVLVYCPFEYLQKQITDDIAAFPLNTNSRYRDFIVTTHRNQRISYSAIRLEAS